MQKQCKTSLKTMKPEIKILKKCFKSHLSAKGKTFIICDNLYFSICLSIIRVRALFVAPSHCLTIIFPSCRHIKVIAVSRNGDDMKLMLPIFGNSFEMDSCCPMNGF